MSKSPVAHFVDLIWLDRREVMIVTAYSLAAGILALAVPLAAQSLVNTIAQGIFLQPLVLLTAAVFLGLLLSGILKTLQVMLVEQVQQRLFATLGLRLSEIIPKFRYQAFLQQRGPEELNKFFEVVNVQKSWNKILLDVPANSVEVVLSLLFLAMYGPELVIAGLVLLLLAALFLLLLGYGGLTNSILESKAKYSLAGWLQQIARCQDSVKLASNPTSFIFHTDDLITRYLRYRQKHFNVLLRQWGTFYFLKAVVGSGILGLGGLMVIEGQLSLGQLVAAEIVVLNALKACEKLIRAIEPFFDLLTGLDKLAHLLEIPIDDEAGHTLEELTRGSHLAFRQVSFTPHGGQREILNSISFEVQAGERVSLLADEGAGLSTLARLAVGIVRPSRGQVEIEGFPAYTIKRLRSAWLTDREELFDTNVEENITMGASIAPSDLRWALKLSGLNEHLPWMTDGLKTPIHCGGRNLSRAQVLRILLARNIIQRPHLLVIDQSFYTLGFEHRIETVQGLFDKSNRWTILNLVAESESLALSDRILLLQDGRILDVGSPRDVVNNPEGPFTKQFPRLFQVLRGRLGSE